MKAPPPSHIEVDEHTANRVVTRHDVQGVRLTRANLLCKFFELPIDLTHRRVDFLPSHAIPSRLHMKLIHAPDCFVNEILDEIAIRLEFIVRRRIRKARTLLVNLLQNFLQLAIRKRRMLVGKFRSEIRITA